MWFEIVETLLPGDPGDGSAQPECCASRMTSAAYSKSALLAKCAQTSPPCIPLVYCTGRSPAAAPDDPKNTSTRVAPDMNASLRDMGYRGEDVSALPEAWGRQTPWQSSSDEQPAADGGGSHYQQDGGYPGQGQPGQAGPGYGPQAGYGQGDAQYGS